MDTNVICTLITAVATVAVAIITSKNHQTSKDIKGEMQEMRNELQETRSELTKDRVQTNRIDIRQMINHSADNIPAVLEVATEYFLVLGGNADISSLFLWWVEEYKVKQWALEHRRNIAPLLARARYLNNLDSAQS